MSENSMVFAQVQAATKKVSRILFIDNLRSAIIILVILHHLAVVYGAGAPFYYVEPPEKDLIAFLVLLVFILINQSWFMGAFFLLSGSFTAGSFDRKGPASFLKDRLLRLGIPLLFFFFVFNPLVSIYGINAMPTSLTHLAAPLTWADYPRLTGVGPLWFVAMLLVFDFGYAGWRWLTRNRKPKFTINSPSPRFFTIVAFVLTLALVSYLVRIILPLGKFVAGFPTLGYLPQYLSFFVLGIIASRNNWLRTITVKMGKVGFITAVVATILLLPVALTGLQPGLTAAANNIVGNGHWQSAIYTLWDSTVSVGVCLGLITFFRRFFDHQGELARLLSQHSFTVYIIHAPIIVLLAVLLKGINLEHLLKFGLIAIIAIPICFTVAYLIRKIPFVSRVL